MRPQHFSAAHPASVLAETISVIPPQHNLLAIRAPPLYRTTGLALSCKHDALRHGPPQATAAEVPRLQQALCKIATLLLVRLSYSMSSLLPIPAAHEMLHAGRGRTVVQRQVQHRLPRTSFSKCRIHGVSGWKSVRRRVEADLSGKRYPALALIICASGTWLQSQSGFLKHDANQAVHAVRFGLKRKFRL